jgi:hypothetical protein
MNTVTAAANTQSAARFSLSPEFPLFRVVLIPQLPEVERLLAVSVGR